MIAFANDLLLCFQEKSFHDISRQAQLTLDFASTWTKNYKFEFNVVKSKVVLEKRENNALTGNLTLNRFSLDCVKELKYLGVVLGSKFCWKQHVLHLSNKCEKIMLGLNKVARNSFEIKSNVSSLIYKQGIVPFICYGSQIWGSALKKKINCRLLRKIQRRILLRVISRYRTISYEAVFAISGFPPIDIFIIRNNEFKIAKKNCTNKSLRVSELPHPSERFPLKTLLSDKQFSPNCACMRQRTVFEGFMPSANKTRMTALFSSLVQIDSGAAMLNGLPHCSDYRGRRVTRGIERLLTTPHSALDTKIFIEEVRSVIGTGIASNLAIIEALDIYMVSGYKVSKGPVNWPPRSCDLTPLDYFLWGYVKSLVYADKPQTLDHLEDNIRRVIANIRPQMLEKVLENWTSRLDYIIASRGSSDGLVLFNFLEFHPSGIVVRDADCASHIVRRQRGNRRSSHANLVAAVTEWSRYQNVVGLVTSSSPVPLKTRRIGERCTLNLSRAQTSSRWCGVVVRRGVPAWVSSTSFDHGLKLCGPSPKALV
ncbi:reverse transcriptase domain-containing protein [Trichonephila clavipes]|nr:reverse transcriptase domain-containing protein [Trichonephila clavipes]